MRLASCLQSARKSTRGPRLVAVGSVIRKLGINSMSNWHLVLEVSAFHVMG